MFCAAAKLSCTPSCDAVSGISCIRPRAPVRETARGLKQDSTRITARTRATGTLWALACLSTSFCHCTASWSRTALVTHLHEAAHPTRLSSSMALEGPMMVLLEELLMLSASAVDVVTV